MYPEFGSPRHYDERLHLPGSLASRLGPETTTRPIHLSILVPIGPVTYLYETVKSDNKSLTVLGGRFRFRFRFSLFSPLTIYNKGKTCLK